MTNIRALNCDDHLDNHLRNLIEFTNGHHFAAPETLSIDDLVNQTICPISIILQITKKCNFDCSFCSETLQLPDPTFSELEKIRDNIRGVSRVFLSGGEPLLRRDFIDVIDLYQDGFVVGVPTNATRGLQHAKKMEGKVAFVNVGLEGPRATTNRVRGDYEEILKGIWAFLDQGIPLSISAVVYRSTLHALPFTYQMADLFGAGKLKLILPLRKGNGLNLSEQEFISADDAAHTFERLSEAQSIHDWKPALRMTTWTPETEGHMILVEVTGQASAWPVYDAPDLLEPLGNLLYEPVTDIWARYRFKRNHLSKYLGRSIYTRNNKAATS